jgi:hypothetical protein
MSLRTIVVSLLTAVTLQCAQAADVRETLEDFGGVISAGTVKGNISAGVIGDQLHIRINASDSSLPNARLNQKVAPFAWERVKVWVLTEDGKTAAPLPSPKSTFSIGSSFGGPSGGSVGGPGLSWNTNLGFERAEQTAAVVVQIDSTFQVFPTRRPRK